MRPFSLVQRLRRSAASAPTQNSRQNQLNRDGTFSYTHTLTDGNSMAVADAAFDAQTGAVQGSQGVFQLTATGMALDLDKLKATVGNVSELDLGQGHNTLSLNLSDVLTQPLTVNGATGDAVELFTAGEPVTATTTQLNGQTYQSYDFNRDGQLDLLVQQAVVVNMH